MSQEQIGIQGKGGLWQTGESSFALCFARCSVKDGLGWRRCGMAGWDAGAGDADVLSGLGQWSEVGQLSASKQNW